MIDAADALLLGVLNGLPAERPAWRKADELLRLPRLDRVVTRHFGWWLVHGALRCNAATVPLVSVKCPAFRSGAAGSGVLFSCCCLL
jgi:hypothetical protein